MLSIVYIRKTENPEHRNKIIDSVGIRNIELIEYNYNGEFSLSHYYNKGLEESHNDFVVFLNDEIEIDTKNWGKKLLKHFLKNSEYGILGVLGTTDLFNGLWWKIKESVTGILFFKENDKKILNKFSEEQNEKIKEVVAITSHFFAVKKSSLKNNFNITNKNLYFDILSFSFSNHINNTKVGVITNIRTIQPTVFIINNEWENEKNIFEEHYKNNLPLRLTKNKTFEEKLIFDKTKIGVGMVTYNAENRIKQSAFTIPKWIEHFVIVNDGTPYNKESYPDHAVIVQHQKNECVGKSKSDAIQWLMDRGCEHIFIIEDDIIIQDENVFEVYIKHSLISGIKHLNFALHGPANKKGSGGFSTLEERAKLNDGGEPNPRKIINYEMDIKIALYPNSVGAFSYYHRKVIESVGLFDPHFKNAWEHVDHTYEVHKKGFHPSFWYFADIWESWKYLTDIPGSIQNSTIARSEEWNKNFKVGSEYYKRKHGFYPTQTPLVDQNKINEELQILYNNRG